MCTCIIAPRDSPTGSAKSALPAFFATVLRVPRRPGDLFIRTAVSHIREYTQRRAASEIVLTPLTQNSEPTKKNSYLSFEKISTMTLKLILVCASWWKFVVLLLPLL